MAKVAMELSESSYLSTVNFTDYFFKYTIKKVDFDIIATLSKVTTDTSQCPAGRILRENGRKLFPGQYVNGVYKDGPNPGVKTYMVGVYDYQSGLSGFIEPNAPQFAIYSNNIPNFISNPIDPNNPQPAGTAPVLTYGIVSGTTVSAGLTVTAGTGITATTGNINAATGNIVATSGQVTAGTTVTAGTGITAATGNIRAITGNITAIAGNIVATTGQVTAGTTVTSGTEMTAGTTMTAGTGITATTGNITATAGQVTAGTTMTAGTGITATTGNITATTGNLVATSGKLVVSSASVGTTNLPGSNNSTNTGVQVNTSMCTSSSKIFVTYTSNSGSMGSLYVTDVSNGSFRIRSTNGNDTATVNWFIVN
jgi:hypothetical protein